MEPKEAAKLLMSSIITFKRQGILEDPKMVSIANLESHSTQIFLEPLLLAI